MASPHILLEEQTVEKFNTPHYIMLQDDRRLSYYQYGQQDGFPIFYFHGWPSTGLDGAALHQDAVNANLRIIAVNRPGCGSDFSRDRTLLDFAEDIEQLADDLTIDTFSVLGQSGGGPYALVCAYKLPERIRKVGVVASMFSGHHPIELTGVQAYPDRIGYHLSKLPLPFMTGLMYMNKALLRMLSPDALMNMLMSEMSERDRNIFQQPHVMTSLKQVLSELRCANSRGMALDGQLLMQDWGFDIHQIQPDVYLWHGDADDSVPVQASIWLASEIPNSNLTIYENEGHGILFANTREILNTLA